jgi:taurine-pyruvate aminotransferase
VRIVHGAAPVAGTAEGRSEQVATVTDSAAWIAKDRRHVWHQMSGRPRDDAAGPLVIAEGDGAWVTDVDGNRYLDGLSGQWCVNVGYGRRRLAQAAAEQLERLAFHPLTRGHLPAIALSEQLDALLGGGRACVYSNSGSEANETAFKVVRQYHQHRGEPHRFKIISRYRAYHGSTLGALAATGQAMRRHAYEPLPPGFIHVPPPDPYRDGIAEDDLEAYGHRCAADLERTIEFELPETVAAVILEPIITGGGILIPPDSYLPAVKAACERHGVLLIVDEVICGFGRTGAMFGHDASGVRPDIVTMAKGITSAYVPLAATVVTEEIFAAFPAGGADAGRLRHINTFGGHPAGCAVALENLAIMEEEGLVERSAVVGAQLLERLREALGGHPLVGDVRGRGLLIGVELVADRATRAPVPLATSVEVMAAAQRHGLLLGRNADTAAGLDNVLALAPPLSLTDEDVDHIVAAMSAAFAEVATDGAPGQGRMEAARGEGR